MSQITLNSAALNALHVGASQRSLGSKLAEWCSVTDFGAVGNGIADDTAAIQAAIDFVIYGASHSYVASQVSENHSSVVFFPKGEYKITDTLHCGYGIEFVHCSLVGHMAKDGYTAIRPTFNDRPALAVSGARSFLLDGLSIFGVNLTWLQNYWTNVADAADRASWIGPNLGPTCLSRYAPYAGIAIDPYAGKRPDNSYPDVRYPKWMGNVAQYGKNFSSGVWINNCVIQGFAVGVAVQPSDADGNGDYVMITHSDVQKNIISFALGNAQARTSNFVNNLCTYCHTAIDGVTFGKQRGNVAGEISGVEFSVCYQIFNINMGFTHPIHVSNCYLESGHRIGHIGRLQTALNPLKFSGCTFSFDQMTNNGYTPPALIDCSASHMVEFDSCNFQTPNSAMFVIGTSRAVFRNCRIHNGALFDTATIAGKIATSACFGIWDNYTLTKRRMDVEAIRPSGSYMTSQERKGNIDDQTGKLRFC